MKQRALIDVVTRQVRCVSRSEVHGVTPHRGKAKRLPPKGVGEQPRVDYFELFEEAYGAKEMWQRGSEKHMQKVIPLMARKIDDLRERIADMHRYHRLYKLEAVKELKKIPLYKREAWMSPDLTRSLVMEDLKSKGYLTESGELKTLEQLREDIAKLPPAGSTPASLPLKSEGDSPADVPATTSTQPPTVPATAQFDYEDMPVVVDPLLGDVHAPTFAPQPEEINITAAPSKKVPSKNAVLDLAYDDSGLPPNVDKIWARYPRGEVQADLDSKLKVTEVKPTQQSEHLYEDPTPRRYGKDGREITNKARVEGTNGRDEQHELGGQRQQQESIDEEEEYEEDPVLARLQREKLKRKGQLSHLWAHLNEPEVKPGEVVHSTALALMHDVEAEGRVLSIGDKIKEVEARMMSPEAKIDLAGDYPAQPERGPDKMDKYSVHIQNSGKEELILSNEKIEYLQKRLKPEIITGGKFVSRLPVNEDQIPFIHKRANEDGVWYARSKVAGEPGRVINKKYWPREAILIPFDIHKAATRGQGYERIRAQNAILELTDKLDE